MDVTSCQLSLPLPSTSLEERPYPLARNGSTEVGPGTREEMESSDAAEPERTFKTDL